MFNNFEEKDFDNNNNDNEKIKENESEKEVNEDSSLKNSNDELSELKNEINRLRQENENLKIQINVLNENYKKQVLEKAIQAEKLLNENIDKLKARYKEEFDNKQKYAIEKDAVKLIDVIDNFDMALKHSPENPQVKNYIVGFKMILNMFHNLLNDLNIKKIEIIPGQMFDHNYMEVLEQVHSDRYKNNQVIEVLRPAYKLHDHIVSFAKVRVAK